MATSPRQIYGFLSQSANPYNISLPWTVSAQDGLFKMNYSLKDAVYDDLLMWARTNRGERPFRFDFGLSAQEVLFEQGPLAKEFLENRTRSQLATYFKYLKILKIEVRTQNEDQDLRINDIRLRINATFKESEQQNLEFDEVIGN